MPSKKRDITIRQVAQELGLDPTLVLDVLKEVPGLQVKRDFADRIFDTARKLGYDFRKLKIGKRMQHRKEILDEVLEKIGTAEAKVLLEGLAKGHPAARLTREAKSSLERWPKR